MPCCPFLKNMDKVQRWTQGNGMVSLSRKLALQKSYLFKAVGFFRLQVIVREARFLIPSQGFLILSGQQLCGVEKSSETNTSFGSQWSSHTDCIPAPLTPLDNRFSGRKSACLEIHCNRTILKLLCLKKTGRVWGRGPVVVLGFLACTGWAWTPGRRQGFREHHVSGHKHKLLQSKSLMWILLYQEPRSVFPLSHNSFKTWYIKVCP